MLLLVLMRTYAALPPPDPLAMKLSVCDMLSIVILGRKWEPSSVRLRVSLRLRVSPRT